MKKSACRALDIRAGRRVIRGGSCAWWIVSIAGIVIAALVLLFGLRLAFTAATIFDGSGDPVPAVNMDAGR